MNERRRQATGGQWLVCWEPRPDARLRLVCVPYAGGGASAYRQWSADLPDIEVWAVRLPGREGRFGEPPPASVDAVVPPMAEAIAGHVRPPWVFFGHSMGALLAWRTTQLLAAGAGPLPECLFVSGSQAPHIAPDFTPDTVDDAGLVAWLRQLGGLPAEVLADRQLLALLLPTIRADLRLCGSSGPHGSQQGEPAGGPLPVPVVAFAGADDRVATADDVAAWAGYTEAGFRLIQVPGDHFFLQRHRRDVTAAVASWARATTGRRC
jgi:surfactin synthase thioesterase subunit